LAYVVLGGEAAPRGEALRRFLRTKLPEYMVPAAFVELAALPLTANGKVDRGALPAPVRPEREHPLVAPRTPVEAVLAGIWAEILGVEQVGVHDDFFDLGGHSLLASRLIARANQAFGLSTPLRSLFEAPTVAGLAEQLIQHESVPGK